MTLTLSQRVQKVKPSPTLAVTTRAAELRAEGKDVLGLGAGEPDFDTPEHIKQAANQAIKDGQTKYTAVDGTPGLKQAIADKFLSDNGFSYQLNQIIVGTGGKQCIFNLLQALIDEGDEVLIPAPYWVSYPDMVKLADGTPVIIEAGYDQQFKITPEQLEAAITPKTKLLILNSPSNPTGVMYSRNELQQLAQVLIQHPHVFVATDDMYEHIIWGDEPFVNILNVAPDLYERTIVLNGVSKAYSMTGWRIGYAAGPAPLIGAMKKIQSQSTSNPSSISQAAAEAALRGDKSCLAPMIEAFKQRHDYMHQELNKLQGFECLPCDGTFYIFPNVQKAIDALPDVNNDIEFAEYLLNEVGIAAVPGSAFGCEGAMRFSFACSMEMLEDAIARLKTLF